MVWAHDPVADPRFPSLSLGKNLLFGKIFAKKLQENERNWTEKECGSAFLARHLDPPMWSVDFTQEVWFWIVFLV